MWQARRLPLTPAQSKFPWIQSTHHGQECHTMSPESWILSPVVPTGTVLIHLFLSVHGDSSGAGGSSGYGFPATCLSCRGSGSGCWGTLWDPCHAQKEASASELSPRRASCSCGLSCSCLFSPGGLLIPRSCPMEFFGGGSRFWL